MGLILRHGQMGAKTKNKNTKAREIEQTATRTVTEVTDSQKLVKQRKVEQMIAPAQSQFADARPKESTSLRTVVAHHPYSPARRLDKPADLSKRGLKDESRPNRLLGMLLLFAALGFAFVGYWNFHYSRTQMREKTKIAPHSGDSSSEDRSRVDFYRHQLGHRLNQQRVGVELQNYSKAPGLSDVDLPQVTGFHDTLGVPIAPQTIENTTGVYSSRYQTEPLSPDHPDARIYYGLQEEQHRDEYVRQANRDYVEQFIRNAKREGLKVEIDSDYNVIEVHRESGGSRKNPGAVQGPAR